MNKYRKKPVVIEAIQWVGNEQNLQELKDFMGESFVQVEYYNKILVQTEEGGLTASLDDWIIKGVKGEFYPCKPDIFAATYEAVEA